MKVLYQRLPHNKKVEMNICLPSRAMMLLVIGSGQVCID
jgi:hypothetical protein